MGTDWGAVDTGFDFVSPEEIDREVTLVRLTGACPYCDGPVDRTRMRNDEDEPIIDFDCEDCQERWLTLELELPDQ